MAFYNYSKISDFTNGLDESKLKNTIDMSQISKTLICIKTFDDDVALQFTETLTNGDIAILATIISSHYKEVIKSIKFETIVPAISSTNCPVYRLIASYVYSGNKILSIKKIVLDMHQDIGITSYSVRIFDKSNSKVMHEATFTDTSTVINIIDINNVPYDETIIEIHIKVLGGNLNNYLHIRSIKVCA